MKGGVTLTGMPEEFPVPVGLRLNQVARAVARAFDDALAGAGGSLPVWLILLNLKTRRPGNQRELAAAVGITGATLTHHLNAMDAAGLITRTRDAANRRVQVVALTEAGAAAFVRLRGAAVAFDARLNAGLTEAEQATLGALLCRLGANVGCAPAAECGPAGPPGPADSGPGSGSAAAGLRSAECGQAGSAERQPARLR